MNEAAVNALLPPEVIEAFTSSAVTALEELTQVEAFPAGATAGATTIASDAVIAVMRLQRPHPGTLTLALSPETARRLAESYLPAGTELTDEIISDVAGELVNVIAGQAKTILKGTPYHYALSIPAVSRPTHCEALSGVEIAFAFHTGRVQLLIDLCPCPG